MTNRDPKRVVRCALFVVLMVTAAHGKDDPVSRKEDVIYGRKYGLALTMDVFTPQKANGKAIVSVISGGWFSAHDGIGKAWGKPFWERGYTVFAVVHGSQPKFTIPEIL